ncbi:GNAT family N-acetyltransferase [Rossellomorea vietnamensis]|uniref:GNAT family N-acetyltransferase n=1 Tax=Rossellomorea vietnamensis TaxID=218284 RepID=UPI003CEDDFAF
MVLTGERIYLRPFEESDAEILYKLITRNKSFWGETEPDWQEGYYTFEGQLQNIRYFQTGMGQGQFFTFGIFTKRKHNLIGIINLYEVKRGPFQSGVIGYCLDKNFNGRGLGTESLRLILPFAFITLELNRLSAEVMPRNYPSIRVLEKAGFQKEGFRRDNIMIKGAWESHLQFALLKKDWV